MAAETPPPPGKKVREALLQKVCGNEEMLSLGTSIASVVKMASSDDEGLHDLAYYVLSDVALTQRILRLSNTAQYKTAAGTPVTTISRAISLLGFDNVKATALAMLLVDALSNSAHAQSVRIELEQSLCASLVGREMARRSPYPGGEEVAIGALFKNLGPLLVASHEYDRYREISALIASGQHQQQQAAQMILGCTYDALSDAVMTEWKIPDSIKGAVAPLGGGVLKAPNNKPEWLKQVSSLSSDVAKILARPGDPSTSPDAAQLITRYGQALGIDAKILAELFATVKEEMSSLLQSMNMQPLEEVEPDHGLPNVLLLATMGGGEPEPAGFHPSGKPTNARELLLAGVQDVTQMRAAGESRVNELILAVLETLYRAMGFRFATVCLKDPRTAQYRARVAFGEDHGRKQDGFCFPIEQGRDIFYLSMENDADLMIADSTTQKIRDLLPPWHKALLPDARSFIVLPLCVGKVQLGLFYADRTKAAPEGVPADETSLIKALKSQVLAALGNK